MKIGKEKRVIDDKIIEVAHSEMKKNVVRESRTRKFRRMYWMPAIALILIFGAFSPWIFTNGVINQMENNFIWGSTLLPVEVASLNDLTPKKTKSIAEIAELKNESISSFAKTTNKQTTAYVYEDKIIALEEYSMYKEIGCYLLVMNRGTRILEFESLNIRFDELFQFDNRNFYYQYIEEEQAFYIQLAMDYQYYFKLDTDEMVFMEEILKLLSEN